MSSVSRSQREGVAPAAPRIAVAVIIGSIIFGILVLRLWALTVLGGAEYAERASQNTLRQLPVEAPRGRILDRDGTAIVTNAPARQVQLDLQSVPEEELQRLLGRLATILDKPLADIQKTVKDAPPGAVEPIVIDRDVEHDQVIWYLNEHAEDLPGVLVRTIYRRSYEQGTFAAHILGQVGEVSPEELKDTYTTLKPGDRVGKSGIERKYDQYLRGTNGFDAVEVDASGSRQGEGRGLPATPGRNLRTTLDGSLQKRTERALANGINRASTTADGRDAVAGAAVAIDPNNGELLATASFPTFDPNIFVTPGHSREITWLYSDFNKRKPSLNRAIAGEYPPGSIFKPITAIAAMAKNFMESDSLIDCPSALKISGHRFPNHDKRSFGEISLKTALETSCDTFFYRLAVKFYNDPKSPLQEWMGRFGLGERTGIDVAGETAGVVPTPAYKRKQTQWPADEREWRPGDSVNMSIGQGLVLTTPLQMTSVYATIANGGTVYTPHIGQQIEDPSGLKELDLDPGPSRNLKLDPGDLEAVREGLVAVNQGGNGTASAVFQGFPVSTAGKTGTSEKLGQSDLAWYCGYAPVDDPQIAACAFIDGGGHGGSAAAPIVREMFEEFFEVKSNKPTTAAAATD